MNNLKKLKQNAQEAAEASRFHEASKLLKRVLAIETGCQEAWATLGHCYLLQHKYSDSLQAYKRAEELLNNQTDCELSYGIGVIHFHQARYDQAEQAFQAVLKARPNFEHREQVLFKLGLLHCTRKNYSKAILFLRNVLGSARLSSADKIEAICSIGLCYWKLQKPTDAVYTFREAITLDSESFKALLHLGWSMCMRNKPAEAQRVLQKASGLARSPWQKFQAFYWLARSHLRLQNFRQSQAAFQKAVTLNPNEPIVWNSVGILYAQAGQLQNAFECFGKALRLSPEGGPSWKNLGLYWANLGVLFAQSGADSEAELALANACAVDSTHDQLKDSLADPEVLDKLAHNPSDDPSIIFLEHLGNRASNTPLQSDSQPRSTPASARSIGRSHQSTHARRQSAEKTSRVTVAQSVQTITRPAEGVPEKAAALPAEVFTPPADVSLKLPTRPQSKQSRGNVALPSVPGLVSLKGLPRNFEQMTDLPTLSSVLNQFEDKRGVSEDPPPFLTLPTLDSLPDLKSGDRRAPSHLPLPQLQSWPAPDASSSSSLSGYFDFRNQRGCGSPQYAQQYPCMVGIYAQSQMPAQVLSSAISQWTHHTNPMAGFMRSINLMAQARALASKSTDDLCQKRPPGELPSRLHKK